MNPVLNKMTDIDAKQQIEDLKIHQEVLTKTMPHIRTMSKEELREKFKATSTELYNKKNKKTSLGRVL